MQWDKQPTTTSMSGLVQGEHEDLQPRMFKLGVFGKWLVDRRFNPVLQNSRCTIIFLQPEKLSRFGDDSPYKLSPCRDVAVMSFHDWLTKTIDRRPRPPKYTDESMTKTPLLLRQETAFIENIKGLSASKEQQKTNGGMGRYAQGHVKQKTGG